MSHMCACNTSRVAPLVNHLVFLTWHFCTTWRARSTFCGRTLPRATGIVACFSLIKAQSLSVSSHMQRASSRTCYCVWDCDSLSPQGTVRFWPHHGQLGFNHWQREPSLKAWIPYFPFSSWADDTLLHVWSMYMCERAGMALVTGGPFAATSLG